jgi:hypothetical protein
MHYNSTQLQVKTLPKLKTLYIIYSTPFTPIHNRIDRRLDETWDTGQS